MAERRKLGKAGTGLVCAAFVLSFASWYLFVGRLGTDELWGAVPGSALGALATWVVLEQRIVWFRDGKDVLEAWRLPGYMFTGTAEIFQVLLAQLFARKPAPSLILQVPYEAVGDDPHETARRALAVTYTTSTPNFIVLGIDRERGMLVFHQIKRGPVLEVTKRLGAKP
jgi:multisubunit Na+/H+ antiporter MnhE subunit